MGEPPEDNVALLSGPLVLAKQYWENARRIGDPGSPSMLQAAELQHQHAEMARTAALVSIAENLERIATTVPGYQRRVAGAAKAIETVAKELTAMRYLLRKGAS